MAADPGAGGGLAGFLLPFVLLFFVWYFLVILPQQRQKRKTQEMLTALKTGDRVLTTGGIFGTIAGFRDTIVQLQVANQVRIEVARSAISGLAPPAGEGKGENGGGGEAARKEAAGKGKR